MVRDQLLNVFDLDLLRIAGPHEIADRGFRDLDRQGRAAERHAREQTINGAFEIASIAVDHLRDIVDDIGRHFETGLPLLRDRDARRENRTSQFDVERTKFEADSSH